MRPLIGTVVVAVFALTVWWTNPTVGSGKPQGTVSIDPASLTSTITNLPTQ